MCAMTEMRIRALRYIPVGWKRSYFVCRGNVTGREFYLGRPDSALEIDELDPFRPLYRVKVTPKRDIIATRERV